MKKEFNNILYHIKKPIVVLQEEKIQSEDKLGHFLGQFLACFVAVPQKLTIPQGPQASTKII